MLTSKTPQGVWDKDLVATPDPHVQWIWHGLFAKGVTTALTGFGKVTGKTTLLSVLLSRRVAGGQLANLAVAAGKTVVISEEPDVIWNQRVRQYDFGGNIYLFPSPFLGVPTKKQWHRLLRSILKLHDTHGFDLLVIDGLSAFLLNENVARCVYDALLPLRALTDAGFGVVLIHHFGKKDGTIGRSSRGSMALIDHVDISMEMRHPGGYAMTRRRRFDMGTRFRETPLHLVLELNAEATDYSVVDASQNEFQSYLIPFQMVLQDAPQKLTRQDILALWPEDFDRPCDKTLRNWLERSIEQKWLAFEGSGHRGDPFRYWLPATEEKWRQKNPLYDRLQERNRELKIPFQSWQKRQEILRSNDMDPDDPPPPLHPIDQED